MQHYPVALPVNERSQRSFESPKGNYTKKFRLIGHDIVHVETSAPHDFILEHLDVDEFSEVVRKEQLSGQPLHLVIDCTNIAGISYSCKKEFTNLIFKWNPDFRQIVLVAFYNIDPGIRVQLEMFRSIAPHGLPFILAGNYEEAISAAIAVKSGRSPEDTGKAAKERLEPAIRDEFLSTLARMAWLKLFDQQIYLPPATHSAYPFFKAIEAIQGDFKAMELEHEMLLEHALEEHRRQLAQKTTALNAQIELNRKTMQQFKDERLSLASRLSTQDLESTRISTANVEKRSTLNTLCELIAGLDTDPRVKHQLSNCCLSLMETGQKERLLNTDLTEADSVYISMLQKKHPNLNQRELRICLLIKLDYNSRDISRLMGLSVRGIESIRYRLHRKIGIGKHQSLKTYLTDLSIATC